jgi:hypothetical protein
MFSADILPACEKHPFRAHDLYQCFVRAKSSLDLCSRPTLLVLIAHFAFRLIESPNRIALARIEADGRLK